MEEYPQINVPNDLLEFDFEKDGSTDLLLYLFGIYDLNKPPRFDPRMEVNVPKGHVHNDQPIRTSMGNYIYNRVLLDDDLLREVGFVNDKFSSKVYKKLANNVVEAFADGRVKVQSVIKFIDNSELYGFGRCDAFVSSITPKIAFVDERVKKRKKELLLQYRKEIAEGDTNAAVAIRDELIKVAKECIGDDPGLDLFESGTKASMQNNYASLFLLNGAMKDLNTGKYRISTSSYYEGIKKHEVDLFANAMVNSCYEKGVGTQVGGYATKKYDSMFQSVKLNPKKFSDCGTKKTNNITLTKFNYSLFEDKFINENGKIVCLTKDKIEGYIGKTVNLYTPTCCIGDQICYKCAGAKSLKIGIINIGLTEHKTTSSIMNKSLKKMHDTSINIYEVTTLDGIVDQ